VSASSVSFKEETWAAPAATKVGGAISTAAWPWDGRSAGKEHMVTGMPTVIGDHARTGPSAPKLRGIAAEGAAGADTLTPGPSACYPSLNMDETGRSVEAATASIATLLPDRNASASSRVS
jgi:hypothetical protein